MYISVTGERYQQTGVCNLYLVLAKLGLSRIAIFLKFIINSFSDLSLPVPARTTGGAGCVEHSSVLLLLLNYFFKFNFNINNSVVAPPIRRTSAEHRCNGAESGLFPELLILKF